MRMRALPLVLALGLCASSSGCYGSFRAVRALWKWNGELTSNKFIRTLIFWGLVIVPVYELFGLGDSLIFNLIEFWGGSNPIDGSGRAGAAQAEMLADGSLAITVEERRYLLVPGGESRLFVFLDGRQVGEAEIREEGGLLLRDLRSRRSLQLSAEEVEELRARLLPG